MWAQWRNELHSSEIGLCALLRSQGVMEQQAADQPSLHHIHLAGEERSRLRTSNGFCLHCTRAHLQLRTLRVNGGGERKEVKEGEEELLHVGKIGAEAIGATNAWRQITTPLGTAPLVNKGTQLL